jgi:hypothetical protein
MANEQIRKRKRGYYGAYSKADFIAGKTSDADRPPRRTSRSVGAKDSSPRMTPVYLSTPQLKNPHYEKPISTTGNFLMAGDLLGWL